ncbi:MAG: copper transporter [Micrococcales bacterium]|nr:copper transporter [Micrococcales bacterium]
MIDFRYHIVSLISVFLALAVGIVLGAGPLEQTIGQSLTGQVAQLRQEKDTLRSERDSAVQARDDERSFVVEAAPELLADRLTGHRVAIISLGPVPEATLRAVDVRLMQAGADITGHITLTETWTDPGSAAYRRQLSGLLSQHLNPAPQDATTDVTLATSLVRALTGADSANPTTFSDSAKSLLGILTTSDNALVTKNGDLTLPADSVVVVAPPVKPRAAPSDGVQTARLAVVAAAQQESDGAVLVDGARAKGSLVDALLADPTLSSTVASVSGISATSAQVAVPMALAAQIAGKVGHYGHGDGETVLPPRVTPPVPDGAEG